MLGAVLSLAPSFHPLATDCDDGHDSSARSEHTGPYRWRSIGVVYPRPPNLWERQILYVSGGVFGKYSNS